LLKIAGYGQEPWYQVKLAESLGISQPEISNSLARSRYAGLLDESGKQIRKHGLMEFLQYGIAYAFPAKPGPIVRGVPTAHSGPPLNTLIETQWRGIRMAFRNRTITWTAISPLYKNVVKAVKEDHQLHELLSLIDAIRVGRVREKQLAIEELKKRLL
jgi:DNA-binding transcriptional ArsR family regulator